MAECALPCRLTVLYLGHHAVSGGHQLEIDGYSLVMALALRLDQRLAAGVEGTKQSFRQFVADAVGEDAGTDQLRVAPRLLLAQRPAGQQNQQQNSRYGPFCVVTS
jgi:hypothetical protein